MYGKIARTVAALALAAVAFLTGAFLVAPAAYATTSIGGHFCSHHFAYQQDHGVWYQCLDKDGWRWVPTTSPAPTTPAATKTATNTPSNGSAHPSSSSSGTAGALAVTGPSVPLMAGVGAALILAGTAGIWMAKRRKRVEFTA